MKRRSGADHKLKAKRARDRLYYKNNLNRKLTVRLRNRLGHALGSYTEGNQAITYLGCTLADLKTYLESQFTEGMTWENYGKDGWHIDHIQPMSSFDLSDIEQLKQVCHYTNLQPLWAEDNIRKGDVTWTL